MTDRDHFAAAALTAKTDTTPQRNGALSDGPDPDSRVWETPRTPQPHPTPPQGSVQDEGSFRDSRNAKEPVAWAVMERDGFGIECTFTDRDEAAEWCDSRQQIVPLYRHPQPAAWQLVHENERLRDESARLREAIRRLADQDATLSVQGGNVTVTMDATPIDFLEQKNDQSNRIAALEDQIARLRGDAEVSRLRLEAAQAEPCPYVTGKTTRYCTLTPFTLTDEEREAVEAAVGFCECTDKPLPRSEQIATLRKMLGRLGGND